VWRCISIYGKGLMMMHFFIWPMHQCTPFQAPCTDSGSPTTPCNWRPGCGNKLHRHHMQIPSDFDKHFNKSALQYTGQQWPPYKFNPKAQPTFGHAGVCLALLQKCGTSACFECTCMHACDNNSTPFLTHASCNTSNALLSCLPPLRLLCSCLVPVLFMTQR
jgi:hypothetical protein